MTDEVAQFSKSLGAIDVRERTNSTNYRGLFKRPNYFFLDDLKSFLIVKISRSKLKHFWGVGKKYVNFFSDLSNNGFRFYVVCLTDANAGWVIPGTYLNSCIDDGSLSYSSKGDQYKINEYNLKDQFRFRTTSRFLDIIKNQ
jgi:hypothetical protein